MKYIRTKEYGVCKVINEDKHTLSYENSYVCGCLWKDDYKDQIQYADTIEELCDEFACVDKVTGCHTLWKVVDKNDLILEDYDWFCAIWADTGLIYVAKMNDKGELELV